MKKIIIICLFIISASLVWSECLDDNIDTQACGHKINPGGVQMIPYYDDAYKIHNNGAEILWVPTKTKPEFVSMYNNPPPNVIVGKCYYDSRCRGDIGCSDQNSDGDIDNLESYSLYSSGMYGASVDDCASIYCCP